MRYPSGAANLFAWFLQVLLAIQFFIHGWIFVSPPASLVAAMQASGLSPGFRQFLGVAEILASIGLVLPALTRVLPLLTPLAALGLTIVMVSATVWHIIRGEWWSVMGTVNLLVLVVLAAYLRWKAVPIHPLASSSPTHTGDAHALR
jgi:uncharacterized membrane protein YphA (DoxX/SURF4 family)